MVWSSSVEANHLVLAGRIVETVGAADLASREHPNSQFDLVPDGEAAIAYPGQVMMHYVGTEGDFDTVSTCVVRTL
jgi:hypothetical protein